MRPDPVYNPHLFLGLARSASPARLRAPAVGVFPPRSSQAPRSSVQTPTRPSARGRGARLSTVARGEDNNAAKPGLLGGFLLGWVFCAGGGAGAGLRGD